MYNSLPENCLSHFPKKFSQLRQQAPEAILKNQRCPFLAIEILGFTCYTHRISFLFFFLVVLEFELRASYLQGRNSNTWTRTPRQIDFQMFLWSESYR
jgi:hypothetical protein